MTFGSPSFFTAGIPPDDALIAGNPADDMCTPLFRVFEVLAPLGKPIDAAANTADMFADGTIPVGSGWCDDPMS